MLQDRTQIIPRDPRARSWQVVKYGGVSAD